MNKKTKFLMICMALITLGANPTSFGRARVDTDYTKQKNKYSSAENPAYEIVGHRIGRIELGLNNNGTFGNGFAEGALLDAFTGEPVPSCEYPKSSGIEYLFAGAFWIGAVVGRDTLVSTSADGWSIGFEEFMPESANFGGKIKKRSILFPDIDSLYDGAVSEEDYIMVYRDTATAGIPLDDQSGRPHTPLNIEVTQRSFAWSYPYADDFILFDYEIKNIGIKELENVYMGIYVDGDVGSPAGPQANSYYSDDLSGFIETFPAKFLTCDFVDTVNIAWLADNDGDPNPTEFDENSPRAVTGTRIIRTPEAVLDVSFNWWVSGAGIFDYGPRERPGVGRLDEPFRDLGTGTLGTPEGDANKYYFMRNREFDFDQYRIKTVGKDNVNHPEDTLFQIPNPTLADAWALGLDTRYLLSFGPFNINPGERLPLSFAYVAGDSLHTNPANIANLPDNPDAYYQGLNFGPLALNASWAARVYDNPGVDTDDNGSIGKFRECCTDSSFVTDTIYDTTSTSPLVIDTTIDPHWTYLEGDCEIYYYEGDGTPDFQGASPPPAPEFWLTPSVGSIHIRFNGLLSETTKDVFSRIIDFEGYRIYYSRDDRESSYSLHSSYDLQDYNKYVWDANKAPEPGYVLNEKPFELDTLRMLYGDSINDLSFNPEFYTRNNPFSFGDSVFYFEPQDYNASIFGVTTPITKIYPNEPFPSTLIPDSALPGELTPDGKFKYFEYEATIDNLLPTVPYYVNVTAFDFGSPESGLTALESSKALGAKVAYASTSAEQNLASKAPVYTYPNPYRYDGDYDNLGFEKGSGTEIARDRIRSIHFANLPPKCTIKIFSLDGDLIREIEHDVDPSDPTSGHERWNLITRNTQLTVSGLYYWTVEAPGEETQIGKLVIIM